jgi:MSHA pilin protein MshC
MSADVLSEGFKDRKESRGKCHLGFTLIELIMVILIIGTLAVYAAPRVFDNKDFYARGFHDETLAYLRYAQKTAIAQRRTVCVTFPSTSSLALAISLNPATANCTIPLTGPNGTTTLTAKTGSGVAYSAAPAPTNFNFNGLGQPITGVGVPMPSQTMQVIGVSKSITVEAATGYVHD